MCVYTCVCECVCVHIHVYIYLYRYICAYIYMCHTYLVPLKGRLAVRVKDPDHLALITGILITYKPAAALKPDPRLCMFLGSYRPDTWDVFESQAKFPVRNAMVA